MTSFTVPSLIRRLVPNDKAMRGKVFSIHNKSINCCKDRKKIRIISQPQRRNTFYIYLRFGLSGKCVNGKITTKSRTRNAAADDVEQEKTRQTQAYDEIQCAESGNAAHRIAKRGTLRLPSLHAKSGIAARCVFNIYTVRPELLLYKAVGKGRKNRLPRGFGTAKRRSANGGSK